jgi:hypothetical protein
MGMVLLSKQIKEKKRRKQGKTKDANYQINQTRQCPKL